MGPYIDTPREVSVLIVTRDDQNKDKQFVLVNCGDVTHWYERVLRSPDDSNSLPPLERVYHSQNPVFQ